MSKLEYLRRKDLKRIVREKARYNPRKDVVQHFQEMGVHYLRFTWEDGATKNLDLRCHYILKAERALADPRKITKYEDKALF